MTINKFGISDKFGHHRENDDLVLDLHWKPGEMPMSFRFTGFWCDKIAAQCGVTHGEIRTAIVEIADRIEINKHTTQEDILAELHKKYPPKNTP